MESVDEKTCTIQECYQTHHMFHHAVHLSCEFCCQILNTFPAFSYYKRKRGKKFGPSLLFTHTYGNIDCKKKMPRRSRNPDNKPQLNQNELKTCDECDASFKTSFNKDRHYMNVHYFDIDLSFYEIVGSHLVTLGQCFFLEAKASLNVFFT